MPHTILVDTDVFSYLWQDRPEAALFHTAIQGHMLALSFTSVGELWYGAYKRGWGDPRKARLDRGMRPYAILPYTRDLSHEWGRLRAALEEDGQPLAPNDLWIAATALHYGIPLATNNRRHFQRVPGLMILPTEPS